MQDGIIEFEIERTKRGRFLIEKLKDKLAWSKEGIKYLCVGILNTCVGYGVIFLLVWCGMMIEVANILGYAVGILVSYLLNKSFTFQSKQSHRRDLPRFVLAMGIAFLCQFTFVSILYRFMGVNAYIALVIGGGVYVVVGFVCSKVWVFKT